MIKSGEIIVDPRSGAELYTIIKDIPEGGLFDSSCVEPMGDTKKLEDGDECYFARRINVTQVYIKDRGWTF
jgi:hypothetical protein